MTETEALNRLFAEFPDFAAQYRAKNEGDDEWAFSPYTAFGLWGFASFFNEQVANGLDEALIRRCLAFIEELAEDNSLHDLIEVGFLENLGHLEDEYRPQLREKLRALLGPRTAELLQRNEQRWQDVAIAQAKDPNFEPHWVRMKAVGDLMPPLDVKIHRATHNEVEAVLALSRMPVHGCTRSESPSNGRRRS